MSKQKLYFQVGPNNYVLWDSTRKHQLRTDPKEQMYNGKMQKIKPSQMLGTYEKLYPDAVIFELEEDEKVVMMTPPVSEPEYKEADVIPELQQIMFDELDKELKQDTSDELINSVEGIELVDSETGEVSRLAPDQFQSIMDNLQKENINLKQTEIMETNEKQTKKPMGLLTMAKQVLGYSIMTGNAPVHFGLKTSADLLNKIANGDRNAEAWLLSKMKLVGKDGNALTYDECKQLVEGRTEKIQDVASLKFIRERIAKRAKQAKEDASDILEDVQLA